ncbi:MAG: type II toxin-antitoxin system VapC family toxin [Anaerolineae bacterium]
MSQICIDASLALKLVLPEPESDQVQAQWQRWLEEKTELVAPTLFIFEGLSAIRLNVTRKLITAQAAELAFREFLAQTQEVRLLLLPDLHERAWELAKRFKQSQVYDAYYLALAESLGCEFWTADEHLYKAVHRALPWVQYIKYIRATGRHDESE